MFSLAKEEQLDYCPISRAADRSKLDYLVPSMRDTEGGGERSS
jgi:hypothetical protein